jgi:hypothetical protein
VTRQFVASKLVEWWYRLINGCWRGHAYPVTEPDGRLRCPRCWLVKSIWEKGDGKRRR